MMNGFDRMFDFNRDGALDRGERAMQFQFFEQMDHSSRSYDDDDDRQEILDDLDYMDADERREALEDMGYDADDFDDF